MTVNGIDDASFDNGKEVFADAPEVGDSCPNLSCHRNAGFEEVQQDLFHATKALQDLTDVGTLDLLEVCAPWDSPLRSVMRERGGNAMSIGVHNGYDLTTLKGFRAAAHLIRTCEPRYLHVSPPCDPWTAIQNCNQRNPEQVQQLQERRQISKRLLRYLRQLVEIQVLELNGKTNLTTFPSPTSCRWGTSAARSKLGNSRHESHGKTLGGRFSVHGCERSSQ